MFNLKENIDKTLPDWSIYTDEADNYTYFRCLNAENAVYEVLHVRHGAINTFVHAVLFLSEYDDEELSSIVAGFGYKDLDDFVVQTTPFPNPVFVYDENGKLDKEKSESYYIDFDGIACMLAETMDGHSMSNEDADRLADEILGKTKGEARNMEAAIKEALKSRPNTNK